MGVLVEATGTKNLKSGVGEEKEKQGVEMDYSSIKMLLLIMSGVEQNPGPGRTNLETTNWLSENAKKCVKDYKLCTEAEQFFGRPMGSMNTVVKWKKKFEQERFDLKREISLKIMKENGGLMGKRYFDNPPTYFFPRNKEYLLSKTDNDQYKCKICEEIFVFAEEVTDHIKHIHQKELGKYFRKEANDLVIHHEQFKSWLNKETDIEIDLGKTNIKYEAPNARVERIQKENMLLKANNRILEANQKTLLKSVEANKDSIKLVRETTAGTNIFETRREVVSENSKGELKRTVVCGQVAAITKRKTGKRTSEVAGNDDPPKRVKISGEGERNHALILENALNHLAEKDFHTKVNILSKLIDKEGENFAASLLQNSTAIQNHLKLSPEDTAALIAATGGNDNMFTKIRTATNKKLGFTNLASHRQVKIVRAQKIPIDRDDWLESKEMLYKLKQGQNARKQTETCVLKVKDLKTYIGKIVVSEAENLTHLRNGDKLKICYDADGGGGRFIAEFSILNGKDQKITLHPFLIYEGTDVRENLEVVFSSFTNQIFALEGEHFKVNGIEVVVEQFGVFDLCCLNTLIGKQSHSATYPDCWTDVTREHLQNHKYKDHTPNQCKSINFLSLKDYDKNVTHHSVHSGLLHFRHTF